MVVFFIGTHWNFDVRKACRIASYVSCRSNLENFGKGFVKKHRTKASQRFCDFNLCPDAKMAEVFTHFEICMAVTSDEKMLLGDSLGSKLRSRGCRLPTTGNFVSVFSRLSHEVHTSDILKDDVGRVIVPYDLDPPIKRFWVRFLLADEREVVILDCDGQFREPKPGEINTPGNTPPSSDSKPSCKNSRR